MGMSGGGFVGFAAHDGFAFAGDDVAGDFDREDVTAAGDVEHDVEHQAFEEAAQRTGAGAFLVRGTGGLGGGLEHARHGSI